MKLVEISTCVLLAISLAVRQQKNFHDRLTFDKVGASIKVTTFLWPTVYLYLSAISSRNALLQRTRGWRHL